jgi:hypothetical protein
MAADSVGWHLKAVFKESDSPSNKRYLPQRHVRVFEVAVPGKGIKMLEIKRKTIVSMKVPYPIPRSEEDSSGVPQTRQITAEQSPQVRGSVTCRAQLGQ